MSYWLVARLEASYEPSDSEGQEALDSLKAQLEQRYQDVDEDSFPTAPEWEASLGAWDRAEEAEHFFALAWVGPTTLLRASALVAGYLPEGLGDIRVTDLDWSSRQSTSLGRPGKQLPAAWIEALKKGRPEQRIATLTALLDIGMVEESRRWGKIIAAELGAPAVEPRELVLWYLKQQEIEAIQNGHPGLALALEEAKDHLLPGPIGDVLGYAAVVREGCPAPHREDFVEVTQKVMDRLAATGMKDKQVEIEGLELIDLSSRQARECFHSCVLPEQSVKIQPQFNATAGNRGLVVLFRTRPKDKLRYILAHELAHKMTNCSIEQGDRGASSWMIAEGLTDLRASSWGIPVASDGHRLQAALCYGLITHARISEREIFYLSDAEIEERMARALNMSHAEWNTSIAEPLHPRLMASQPSQPLSTVEEALEYAAAIWPAELQDVVLSKGREYLQRLNALQS